MDIDVLRDYCLAKKGVTEELPFGPDTLVFKVMGKMFALVGLDEVPLRVNLKCDPEKAVQLREEYSDTILPGYHMNKQHWNTVVLDGSINKTMILEFIDHSYTLVVSSLTKKIQQELNSL